MSFELLSSGDDGLLFAEFTKHSLIIKLQILKQNIMNMQLLSPPAFTYLKYSEIIREFKENNGT